MPHLKVNKADIYYEVRGQGQPLVFIAGFGCDHSLWGRLVENLASEFQILVLDNRGSGQTKDDGANFSLETMADDVMALVNFLGWERPNIVGHSMGGGIAQDLGIRFSDKLGKIMLFNTAAKLNAVSMMALNNTLKLQKAKVDIDLLIESFMPWVFSDTFLADPLEVALYKKTVKEYPYPQTEQGNERQIKALEMSYSQLQLNKIQAETLIVGADRDLLVTEQELKFLNNHIPNSILKIFPGSHALPIEQLKLSTSLIIEFLKAGSGLAG